MIRATARSVWTASDRARRRSGGAGQHEERSATMSGREQVEGIMGQLEELWGHKHGPDWTFADLQRPLYMPLLGMGWVNAGMGLMFPVIHNWSEVTQLRVHMGRAEPVPSAAVTNTYLGAMIGFMGMFMDRSA